MTQDQFLTLRKYRSIFDQFMNTQSWRPSPELTQQLAQIRMDLFGKHTNWWCGGCIKEALCELYAAADAYEAANAPIILTASQTAEVQHGRNTKGRSKRVGD